MRPIDRVEIQPERRNIKYYIDLGKDVNPANCNVHIQGQFDDDEDLSGWRPMEHIGGGRFVFEGNDQLQNTVQQINMRVLDGARTHPFGFTVSILQEGDFAVFLDGRNNLSSAEILNAAQINRIFGSAPQPSAAAAPIAAPRTATPPPSAAIPVAPTIIPPTPPAAPSAAPLAAALPTPPPVVPPIVPPISGTPVVPPPLPAPTAAATPTAATTGAAAIPVVAPLTTPPPSTTTTTPPRPRWHQRSGVRWGGAAALAALLATIAFKYGGRIIDAIDSGDTSVPATGTTADVARAVEKEKTRLKFRSRVDVPLEVSVANDQLHARLPAGESDLIIEHFAPGEQTHTHPCTAQVKSQGGETTKHGTVVAVCDTTKPVDHNGTPAMTRLFIRARIQSASAQPTRFDVEADQYLIFQ